MMGSPETALVEGFALGPFATNCYLVHTGHGKEGWFVDAGFAPEDMIERARALELRIEGLLITHAHGDHIAGVPEVRDAYPGVPIIAHEAEASWFTDPQKNLSAAFGPPVVVATPDRLLKGGETLHLGATEWRALHTPGHSPGMLAFHCPAMKVAIVGDTLFAGSIGRYDYSTSNEADLFRSLREVLLALPDDTRILPGHGPATTIGRERQTNPFLRAAR